MSHRHPTLSISINPQLTVMDILRRPKPVILIAMLLMVLSIERQLVWTSGWDLEIGEVASILQESLLDPCCSWTPSQHWQLLQPASILLIEESSSVSFDITGRSTIVMSRHVLQVSQKDPLQALASPPILQVSSKSARLPLLADARSSCHATWDHLQPQHRPTVINKNNTKKLPLQTEQHRNALKSYK